MSLSRDFRKREWYLSKVDFGIHNGGCSLSKFALAIICCVDEADFHFGGRIEEGRRVLSVVLVVY